MKRINVILWEPGLRAEVYTSSPLRVKVCPVEDDAEHYSVHIDFLPEFDSAKDYVVRVVRKGDRYECQLLAGEVMPAWALWTNGNKHGRLLIATHAVVTVFLDNHKFTSVQLLEEFRKRGIPTVDAPRSEET
ncbi:MAG: hypothetical protein K2W82_16495 [Candidatus Obscuribacterales bacterium]|nr:hypothetical protein [Candidatus Obscuribacterales bacterium]